MEAAGKPKAISGPFRYNGTLAPINRVPLLLCMALPFLSSLYLSGTAFFDSLSSWSRNMQKYFK